MKNVKGMARVIEEPAQTTQCVMGELEIDVKRGVLYFHSLETGTTKLRICGLQFPVRFEVENPMSSLDVTLKPENHLVMYNQG
jgi:hypothetical protein